MCVHETGDRSLIERLLIPPIAAVETFTDPPGARLFPQEEPFVARAVPNRRAEFTSGRWCARRALDALGVPPQPLPRGTRGMPEWPSGIVGSITHCAGYRAAAVGTADHFIGIGIDAEPHEPLPIGVLDVVTTPRERRAGTAFGQVSPRTCWDRVLFSAKEAVFKTWYPLARTWLEFDDVDVTLHEHGFTARPRFADPGGRVPSPLRGRWHVDDELVLTAVVLSTTAPPPAEPSGRTTNTYGGATNDTPSNAAG